MIFHVMAVYDSKARAFLLPMYCAHVDVGVRAFAGAANTKGHQIGDHPGDFTLYELGTWDDATGQHKLLSEYRIWGLGSNFIHNRRKERSYVQEQNAPQPVSNETRILGGAKGGDPEVDVRQIPRAQDDVRRGVPDSDPSG